MATVPGSKRQLIIKGDSFIKTGSSSNDILLGDGTTTSLSTIQGDYVRVDGSVPMTGNLTVSSNQINFGTSSRVLLHNGNMYVGDIDNLGGNLYLRQSGTDAVQYTSSQAIFKRDIRRDGSDNNSMLLGGGGTKLLSDFSLSGSSYTTFKGVVDIDTFEQNNAIWVGQSTNVSLGTLPPYTFNTIAHFGGDQARAFQLSVGYGAGPEFFFRRKSDSASSPNGANTWQPWYEVYHSGNLTNVSQLTNDSGYLTTYSDTLDSVVARNNITSRTAQFGRIDTTIINTSNGSQLGIYAGESFGSINPNIGTTSELIYLGAESGVKVISTPDNWGSGWAGRNEALLVDSAGYSSFPGKISVTGHGDSSQWNAAYGWGNHASAGYLTSFSETDTLQSVTDRNATTTNGITASSLESSDGTNGCEMKYNTITKTMDFIFN